MDTGAEARVVASFTFVVALLLGAWQGVDAVLTDSGLLPRGVGWLVVTLLPVGATAVALQASRVTTAPWARTLGGAAAMLGVLSTLGAILHLWMNAWGRGGF